jgi:hypothetical protein
MSGAVTVEKQIPFWHAFASSTVNYYTLALVTLIPWYASARMADRAWSWPKRTAAHVVLGVVLITAWQTIDSAYLRLMVGPSVWSKVYRGTWLFQLIDAVILYVGIVCGMLAVQAARRARIHERRQHEIALTARDAEMRALRAQVEPHFLLNTLNSILALVDTSPLEARTMIERLSELLRASLDRVDDSAVPLGRELEWVEAYLGIERIRFADRLSVTIDVPDSLRGVPVPPLLLQPLAENAVKHGVAPFSRRGFVAIRARRESARMRIEIADSGPGFERDTATPDSRGLTLTERRLMAFAPGSELLVERDPSGGAVVVLRFAA